MTISRLLIAASIAAPLSYDAGAAPAASCPQAARQPGLTLMASASLDAAPAMTACDSGGEGARSCEVKTVINVGGYGGQEGCGITCNDGYYACCQESRFGHPASCTCNANVPRGPWTPEFVW